MAEIKPARRRKKSSSKVEATPVTPAVDPPEAIAEVEPIAVSVSKVLPKDKKYTKIVAIKTSAGIYGADRFTIKDGQTYNLPSSLARWLIETGRAK